MLSYRQTRIVSYILSIPSGVSVGLLMKSIGVSEKTIKNEIKETNKILSNCETICYSHKRGYYIDNPSENFYEILNNSLQNNKEDYIDKNRTTRTLAILLSENDYISMEALAGKLNLSKSMLNKIIDGTWRLRKYIEISQTRGLRIPWEEEKKRSFLAKFTLDSDAFGVFGEEQEVIELSIALNEIISKCLLDYHYTIAGNALKTFHNYLLASIIRRKRGHFITEEVAKVPISNLMKMLYTEIDKELGIKFDEKELWCCQKKLNEMNLLRYDKAYNYGEAEEQIYSCYQKFVAIIKEKFDITIDMDQFTWERFLLHIRKLQIRIANGNDISNFNKRDINANSPFTAQVIRDFFLPVFEMNIKAAEMAYIVLYFAQYLENQKRRHKILYISDSVPSLVYDAKRKIKKQLPEEVAEIECIPVYQYLSNVTKYNNSYIAIITTEIPVIDKNFRALVVNKVLQPEDFELLDIYIKGCVGDYENFLLKRNIKRYLKEEVHITEQCSNIFSVLSGEDIGDIEAYDIVLNDTVGYFASFTEKKSQIKVLKLKHPILYKNRFLKEIIVANYNTEDKEVYGFFQVVRHLINS